MAKKKAAPKQKAEKKPAAAATRQPAAEPEELELSPVEFMGGLYAVKLRELVFDMDMMHIQDVKTRLLVLAQELESIQQ
jgi:hypothetical protein